MIAVPLLTLIAVTSASLALQQHERQERAIAVAASDLSGTADQVLADAVNAETGVRGYAATRDPIFLAPYNLTLTRIGAERRALRDAARVEGDSRRQRQVDATAGRVLAELVQLRSAIGDGTSIGNLRPGLERQKVTMDVLRRQVAGPGPGPGGGAGRSAQKDHQPGDDDQRGQRRRSGAGAARWAAPASPCSPRVSPAGSPRPRGTRTGWARDCRWNWLTARPTTSGTWPIR